MPTLRAVIRFARTAAVIVAAGAAVNVVVALACARWGEHRPMEFTVPPTVIQIVPAAAEKYLNDQGFMHPPTPFRPTPSVEGARPTGFSLGPAPAAPTERETGLEMEERRSSVSTRIAYTRWVDDRFMGYSRTHTLVRFGFPFRSMEYAERFWFSVSGYRGGAGCRLPGWRGGWPIAPSESDQQSWNYRPPAHVYPLTPVLAGTLANTAIYAALVLAIHATARVVRDRLRRRDDLCPRCAYPIGVSPVCTECGMMLKK